jgi:hypothetical protein
MRYKLVTLYLNYEIPAGDKWLVYGHLDIGVNESLGRYDTKDDALAEAFKYGAPVMIGRNYDDVLFKLVF